MICVSIVKTVSFLVLIFGYRVVITAPIQTQNWSRTVIWSTYGKPLGSLIFPQTWWLKWWRSPNFLKLLKKLNLINIQHLDLLWEHVTSSSYVFTNPEFTKFFFKLAKCFFVNINSYYLVRDIKHNQFTIFFWFSAEFLYWNHPTFSKCWRCLKRHFTASLKNHTAKFPLKKYS
jgi:hypothetical protein